jgi:hypothetical protein
MELGWISKMTFRLHTPVSCYFRAWKLFQRRGSVVHDNDYSTHHFNDSYICSTTTNGGNSSLEWIYHHIHVQVIYIIYNVCYIHQLMVITCYYTGYIRSISPDPGPIPGASPWDVWQRVGWCHSQAGGVPMGPGRWWDIGSLQPYHSDALMN